MIKIEFKPQVYSIIIDTELEYIRRFTARMVLDTGASFTMITPKVAEELGCKLYKTSYYFFLYSKSSRNCLSI